MNIILQASNQNTVNTSCTAPPWMGSPCPNPDEVVHTLPMPDGWEEGDQPAGDGYKLVRDCGMVRHG